MVKAGQSHIRVSRRDLGGFWAHVGLEKKPPNIIRKSIFLVFERLNDSTNIANPPSSYFKRDDAPLLGQSGLHGQSVRKPTNVFFYKATSPRLEHNLLQYNAAPQSNERK